MKSAVCGIRHRLLGLLGSFLLAGASLGAATQESGPAETTAPDPLEVQAAERSAAISGDPALNPATRDAALARLKEAQQLLQAAAADRLEATRLGEEREAAPAALAGLAAGEPDADQAAQPEDWSGLSLAQLEIATSEAENLAGSTRQRAAETRQQLADLRNRRPLVGAELAAAREAVTDARNEVARISAAGQTLEGTGSEELLARAREQSVEARLALLEEQRSGADLREQLLDALANAAQRELARREGRLQGLRAELARRRLSEAVAQSSEWQDSPVAGYDAVAALARSNRELAGLYGGAGAVTHRLDQVQRDLARLEQTIAEFDNDLRELRARLGGLGRSSAAGTLIRRAIEELPSATAHKESLERRHGSINETQMRSVALATELRRLERDLPGESALFVSRLPDLRAPDRDDAVKAVSSLLDARRRVIRPLLHDLDQLLNGQVEMQARESDLLANVQDAERYLRSREPWVRNSRQVTVADVPAALGGLLALPSPKLWAGSAAAAVSSGKQRPGQAARAFVAITVGVLTLVGLRRRQRRGAGLDAVAPNLIKPGSVLATALLNGLAALTVVASLGWWLSEIPAAPVALHAMGNGLLDISAGWFVVGFLTALSARHGGVGSVNPALERIAGRVRVALRYLVGILVLLVASRVLVAAGAGDVVANGDLGARMCLLVAALLLAVGIHHARGWRIRNAAAQANRRGLSVSLAFYALSVAIPAAYAVLLVQGFTLAAFELVRALVGTLVVLVVAGTVRVLFLTPGSTEVPSSVDWSSLRQARLDLLHIVVTLVAAAVLIWIWRDVVVALRYLQDVPLWTAETVEGLKTVTVANLLSCLAILGATVIAFWALPLLFATDASDATQQGIGTRYAVIALVRYIVLIVGLASAFSMLNIGWSKLQWLAAGLSVGLGFGLQETAANFFSGLTLLSERSIRVGDLVTVGDKTGVVRRIKVRATTVQDFDGREIIIPNKELVTTQVTNWTLTNMRRRLQVTVGVAYGSDTARVAEKLLEAARGVGGVLSDPPPQVAFEQFGDSALQFRLYAWIDAPDRVVRINHDLHTRINQLLPESGIDISFPQRDVHLHPAGPLEVRLCNNTDGTPATK